MRRQIHPLLAQLRAERERCGLTQATVGKRAGRDETVICRYESGTYNPPIDAVAGWAAALGYRITLVPVGTSPTDDEFTSRLRYLDAERQRPAAKEHPAVPSLSASTAELFQELIGALAQLFDEDVEAALGQEVA